MIVARRHAPFALAVASVALRLRHRVRATRARRRRRPRGAGRGRRTQLPADPWPRVVDLTNAQVLVYQPQVNKWDGNQIDFRAALAIKPAGAKDETFGVDLRDRAHAGRQGRAHRRLREPADHEERLPDAARSRRRVRAPSCRSEFAERGAHDLARPARGVARRSPASSRRRCRCRTTPPQVIVSYSPAILVPIDGAPVLKPVPGDARFAARDQHARADPAGRLRATATTSTSTTAG